MPAPQHSPSAAVGPAEQVRHVHALGPRIRRYRPSIHLSHAVPFLGCGPVIGIVCVAGGLLSTGGGTVAFGLLMLIVLPLITGTVCTFHWSAYLDLHQNGLVVGRSLLGRSRAMWYSEVHPATVRVFTKIDNVRGPFRAQILPEWHFTGGADLAVTFLGPHPASELGPRARRPEPGKGIVLFGSRDAMEIAEQIRTGLERGGCPPHLARWSQRFGVERVKGPHFLAVKQIPGMRDDWTPTSHG